MKLFIIMVIILFSGCAIEPKYEARAIEYCHRKDYTYICPGYGDNENSLNWLIREQRIQKAKGLLRENN